MLGSARWLFACKLFFIHICINLFVALLIAGIVFLLWYPQPYLDLMGGIRLFSLIIVVDLVCGPVLTMVLANPAKPKREMVTDFSLVIIIQLAALFYGIYAIAVSRPVYVVFEVDRFTVVSAAEIDKEKMSEALPEFRHLPWFEIKRIALRNAKDGNEKLKSLGMSLQGVEPSARPDWWVEETEGYRQLIRNKMKPLAELYKKYPDNQDLISTVQKVGLPKEKLYYLPFTSQKNKEWTVLMDKDTNFKAFVPLDAF